MFALGHALTLGDTLGLTVGATLLLGLVLEHVLDTRFKVVKSLALVFGEVIQLDDAKLNILACIPPLKFCVYKNKHIE